MEIYSTDKLQNMKKSINFLIKIILAMLPAIALIAFTTLMPMCYMDEEYPAWRFTMDVVYGIIEADGSIGDLRIGGVKDSVAGAQDVSAGTSRDEKDPSILILGDSRAMADLLPEKFEKSCVNLAVGGATPVEMYYFYESYLKNNKTPECVVVMFAPFHYSYMDNFKTRTLYFNALSIGQQAEIYANARELGADAVLFDDFVAYSASCRLRLPDVYLPAMYNAHFVGRKSINDAAYENLVKSNGQGYFGTDDGNSDPAYEASYTQMADDGNGRLLKLYMEKLMSLLDESGVSVILAQPPVNTTTYEMLDAGYVAEYRGYIESLCSKYDNVNYSAEMIEYDCEYFGDSSHLNKKGAEKFSEEFCTKYKEFF